MPRDDELVGSPALPNALAGFSTDDLTGFVHEVALVVSGQQAGLGPAAARVGQAAEWMATRVPTDLPDGAAYVYLVEAAGRYKIGSAVDVAKRVASIQAMCPVPVTVVAAAARDRTYERTLHREFAAQRLHGEWFALTPEQVDELRGRLR